MKKTTHTDEITRMISSFRKPSDPVHLAPKDRSARPELRVILMTGFSEVLEAEEALKLGGSEFLTKPFKTNSMIFPIWSWKNLFDSPRLNKSFKTT